jgi:DNA end-binding protein Ku
MQQLLYAAEIRPVGELEIPRIEVRSTELKLARQLIEQQASDAFDSAGYEDEVKARIEAAVEKKVAGEEIALAAEAPAGGAQVIDLMEALRASLQKRGTGDARPAQGKSRKAPKRAGQPASAAKRATKK